jgi:hypothetical protein
MKINGFNKNTEKGTGIKLKTEETHVTTMGAAWLFSKGSSHKFS